MDFPCPHCGGDHEFTDRSPDEIKPIIPLNLQGTFREPPPPKSFAEKITKPSFGLPIERSSSLVSQAPSISKYFEHVQPQRIQEDDSSIPVPSLNINQTILNNSSVSPPPPPPPTNFPREFNTLPSQSPPVPPKVISITGPILSEGEIEKRFQNIELGFKQTEASFKGIESQFKDIKNQLKNLEKYLKTIQQTNKKFESLFKKTAKELKKML